MSGIDTSVTNGVRVTTFDASPRAAYNATVRKDSTGPLRAAMTGVEHQPPHNGGGLAI